MLIQTTELQTIKAHQVKGSGRVSSGSEIWPKHSAGFGKTKENLMGYGTATREARFAEMSAPRVHRMRYWERNRYLG